LHEISAIDVLRSHVPEHVRSTCPTQTAARKERFREDAAAQDQLQHLKAASEDPLQSARRDGHNIHHCHHRHHHPPSHQLMSRSTRRTRMSLIEAPARLDLVSMLA